MKDDFKFSLPYLFIFSLEGWENVLFELRSGRVNHGRIYFYYRRIDFEFGRTAIGPNDLRAK